MKDILSFALIALLIATVFLAGDSPLISKEQAQQDALRATSGGTVTLVSKTRELGKIVWLVNVFDRTRDVDVLVDAHDGSVLDIRPEPTAPEGRQIDEHQADKTALKAVGGGTVIQTQLGQWNGHYAWVVTIAQPDSEYDVYVNAHSAALLTCVKRRPASAPNQMITKVEAVKSAMEALGGGKLLLVGLETSDTSRDWNVDVKAKNGTEYEAKVNAYTGAVIAIKTAS